MQTVHNTVGGKAAVLKAVYDTMLAGDDEPIPIMQRPAMAAMTAPELPIRLVHRRGWSLDRYEAWTADAMAHALLPP